MDVLGVRFDDLGSAMAAREAILATVAMPPADVAVRPLGTTAYDQPIVAFLLAGRFRADAVQTVTALAREHGGTIIASHTEWRPRPRAAGDSSTRRRGHPRALPAPRRRRRSPAARLRIRAARGARLRA